MRYLILTSDPLFASHRKINYMQSKTKIDDIKKYLISPEFELSDDEVLSSSEENSEN